MTSTPLNQSRSEGHSIQRPATVIFDFGWTLAEPAGSSYSNWAKTVRAALTRLLGNLRSVAANDYASDYELAVLTEIEDALTSEQPLEIDGLWSRISRKNGPYSTNARSCSIEDFGLELTTGDWRLYREAIPVLDILSRGRTAMGLVSDISSPTMHWAALAGRLGLDHYIQAMAFSEELGAVKPDPRGILSVIDQLQTDPAHAFYVGDTPAKDVDSAVAAGVTPVWLRRRPEARLGRHQPAHTIHTLRDLLTIL
ncbi:MAG: HAD family hydrolase [Chloroflexi bacterium]|nr:HAD family hydrolase [Chloroflexota bacterium]